MEMLNRAIEGAAMFKDMMHKVKQNAATSDAAVSQEIAEWNAEVDRKKAERKIRNYQRQQAASK